MIAFALTVENADEVKDRLQAYKVKIAKTGDLSTFDEDVKAIMDSLRFRIDKIE